MAGLFLDPWQEFVLEHALTERADGSWAASRVGLIVPRQNGKGALLEARELAGLFLLGEGLIVHSAHQFDTSMEAFLRLLSLIENTPDLQRRVKRVVRSHGEEGIHLKGGQRIRFRTRTKGGGRGFSCDCLILDEAMYISEAMITALLPTLSARPNPQVWYTGSAVDQTEHENGIVLARIRQSGHNDDNPRLAFFEWGLDFDHPDEVEDETAADPEAWAQANPGFGIRIADETVLSERVDLGLRGFAVERLGVGDWPNIDGLADAVIDLAKWAALHDPKSTPEDIWIAFDVNPERTKASICGAGRRADKRFHVEVLANESGAGWVPDKLLELSRLLRPKKIVCDAVGAAAALVPELQTLGLKIEVLSTPEHADACGIFFDAIEEDQLRHVANPELLKAIKGAVKRPLGDRWAWSRKNSHVDITALVGCTLALWGVSQAKPRYRSAGFN